MFRVSPGNEEPGPGRVRVISNLSSPGPGRVSRGRVPGSFRVKKDSFTHYQGGRKLILDGAAQVNRKNEILQNFKKNLH